MGSTIAVDKLQLGMFIHLDGGWLSHPFPLSSFRITSAEQIAVIRRLGLAQVRWNPDKSLLAGADAAAPPQASGAETTARRHRELLALQREAQQQCEQQFGEAAHAWHAAWAAAAARPGEAHEKAGALAQSMVDKLLLGGDVGIRLVAGAAGDRAAAHALNVSVIALLLARTLGLAPEEMLDLGLGALLHDVGKIELPERVRHADPGAGAAEIAAYRDHVAKGVVLGKRMGLAAGALAVLAQHHEHADASGFPQRLGGERITLTARIVALVDRYDNLCNPPNRVPPLTPHEAVSMLFAQGRARYDSIVLNVFIRMMGVYPAGSLVQLTDDRYAMVVGVNASRPLKPRVLVHDPQVPRDEALLLDLEHTPDVGVRRSLSAGKLPAPALDYLDPRPRVHYHFEPLGSATAPAPDDVRAAAMA